MFTFIALSHPGVSAPLLLVVECPCCPAAECSSRWPSLSTWENQCETAHHVYTSCCYLALMLGCRDQWKLPIRVTSVYPAYYRVRSRRCELSRLAAISPRTPLSLPSVRSPPGRYARPLHTNIFRATALGNTRGAWSPVTGHSWCAWRSASPATLSHRSRWLA